MTIEVGLTAAGSFTVGDADTAAALGSGDVPVLATPRLIAWSEAVTVRALGGHIADEATTLGTRVELDHVSATAVGTEVTVDVVLSAVDGGNLRFDVHAWQGADDVTIGRGVISRVLVDREKFLGRLRGAG
ncbi:MAG: thioesterase [Geodermatophilaceae bacterium]|nr:thioesterase [Geodermatophilaceae bacterium]